MRTFLVRAMKEGLRWLWRLLTQVLTLVTLLAAAAGVLVVGVLLHQAAWLLVGGTVVALFIVFAEGAYCVWRETDEELENIRGRHEEGGEPQNRQELWAWLDVRIEEIVAWRAILDREATLPVPDLDVTGSIENMFWGGLNNEVHRKLHLLAPEWTGYWGESPDWFSSGLTRITSEQVAELSRMLGWSAGRLRHIKRELS